MKLGSLLFFCFFSRRFKWLMWSVQTAAYVKQTREGFLKVGGIIAFFAQHSFRFNLEWSSISGRNSKPSLGIFRVCNLTAVKREKFAKKKKEKKNTSKERLPFFLFKLSLILYE